MTWKSPRIIATTQCIRLYGCPPDCLSRQRSSLNRVLKYKLWPAENLVNGSRLEVRWAESGSRAKSSSGDVRSRDSWLATQIMISLPLTQNRSDRTQGKKDELTSMLGFSASNSQFEQICVAWIWDAAGAVVGVLAANGYYNHNRDGEIMKYNILQ